MTDSEIEVIIMSLLSAEFTDPSATVEVLQSYNPKSSGPPLAPVVTFQKLFARRFGVQGRREVFNPGSNEFDATEAWFLKATYQVDTFITPNVAVGALNAYDIADLCAGALQSRETRQTLLASEIGIQRITDIRTPKSMDDSDRFQMNASFDFDLTYENTRVSIVPPATVTGSLIRV